jgi:FtsZ-interacting cell division protein ZipA
MFELRAALIGLGVLFLAGLALWEWRKRTLAVRRFSAPDMAPSDTASMPEPVAHTRRVEPGIEEFRDVDARDPDESIEVPTILPVESMRIEVAAETAVDMPTAARPTRSATPGVQTEAAEEPRFAADPYPVAGLQPAAASVAVRWPPENTERVLSLRVVGARGEALPGRQLRLALEAAGMQHGPRMIFHRVAADGMVLASAANLVRPGVLDPAQMDAQEFRGLNVFSVLPNAFSAEQTLEDLVVLARGIAGRLSAAVQDDQGMVLDAERLTQLRRSVQPQAHADGM